MNADPVCRVAGARWRAPSSRARVARLGSALGVSLVLHLAPSNRAQAQTPTVDHMGGMAMDRVIRMFMLADQLEVQPNAPERPINFELVSWIGGDYRRVYLRAQGEQSTRVQRGGELQADALYSRLIAPFWSVAGGVRLDTRPRASRPFGWSDLSSWRRESGGRVTRGLLAVGFIGLAPGWFEFEPTLFVSNEGDVSMELETSVDLLLTQRLILQPRVELHGAVQPVREIGVGSGLNSVELGARVRYEVRRKFAPYLGLSWHRRTGATAAMAHEAGESVGVGTITVGVRLWR